ncbi:WhiB family transcriptional regulator [Nitrosomonas communis]|uniref:WhiB family transcriptional regulator n=1 Tax=Nitrosomonas communis TaxID=44574 RepID=UPI003D2E0A37
MLPERYEYDIDQPGSLRPASERGRWADARCNDMAGTLSGLFFSEELQDIAKAKRVCALCPVMADCLEGALERREPWGVWGGQLLLNGKVLQSKRRRGRPPKVARAEDQLPDVPVPEHLQARIVYRSA